jgi:MFS transporter, SP family, sugar:H+ symporter
MDPPPPSEKPWTSVRSQTTTPPDDQLSDVELGDDSDDRKTTAHAGCEEKSRLTAFVVVVAATAALGAFVFGFGLTGAGGTFVMTGFKEQFGWECPPSDLECVPKTKHQIDTERSLITSLMNVGAIIGALVNNRCMDTYGRRPNLMMATIIIVVGATIQASSSTIEVMLVGRVVGGFAIGMIALCTPVYIAECSPTETRGFLVTFWQVGVTLGMLLGNAVNIGAATVPYGWRFSYGGPIFFAFLQLLGLVAYMPESPRYLATKGDRKQVGAVMAKLRRPEQVEHAVDASMTEVQEDLDRGQPSWTEVLRTANRMRYRVLLGVAMQLLNQLSGNEAINFYTPVILNRIFGSSQSIFNAFLLGIVNLAAVVVTLFVVDRVGRVPLWMAGGAVMLASQLANSVLQSLTATPTTNYAFLACLAVFTFAYHGTFGPLAWDICSEMFPIRERAKAVGLTTMSNFVGVTIVGSVFSYTIDASPGGSFAFFCAMIFLNLCLVYFFLPETSERNAVEIEEQFRKHEAKLYRRIRDPLHET